MKWTEHDAKSLKYTNVESLQNTLMLVGGLNFDLQMKPWKLIDTSDFFFIKRITTFNLVTITFKFLHWESKTDKKMHIIEALVEVREE